MFASQPCTAELRADPVFSGVNAEVSVVTDMLSVFSSSLNTDFQRSAATAQGGD